MILKTWFKYTLLNGGSPTEIVCGKKTNCRSERMYKTEEEGNNEEMTNKQKVRKKRADKQQNKQAKSRRIRMDKQQSKQANSINKEGEHHIIGCHCKVSSRCLLLLEHLLSHYR
jgi:SLT domain-containing protein